MIVEAVGAVEMDGTAMDEMVHHNLIHVGKNLIEMVVSDYIYTPLFSGPIRIVIKHNIAYFFNFPSTHV